MAHQIRNALQKTLLGFLSTAVFFAAFFMIGDVLLAAVAAVGVAIVQFVLWRTAHVSPGIAIWASLAVVIALTGLSLHGDDAFADMDVSQASAPAHNCHCATPNARTTLHALPVPFRERAKVLAPAAGPV